jgi:hypothetical protein
MVAVTHLILCVLILIGVQSFDPKAKDHACADFNKGAAQAALAGLENVFVCPADGIARTICSESFSMKEIANITQSNLKWDDILIYMLMGPRSLTEAFLWWLPLMTEPIDIVIIADACLPNANLIYNGTDCEDAVSSHLKVVREKFTSIRFHVARAFPSDTGYNILSCKLRSGAAAIYKMFPSKRIYFKIDTDTIIFPKRLMSFMHTLTAVADDSVPVYFGTVVESGMSLLLCGREWAHLGNAQKGIWGLFYFISVALSVCRILLLCLCVALL